VDALLTEWWINADSLRPKEGVNYYTFGAFISRFHYEGLNQPIPKTEFQPPVERV
jgi:hypothetical protein